MVQSAHTVYGEREETGLSFPEDEGRTHQSFKRECNINTILAKYQKTGMIDHVQQRRPEYGDVTSMEFKEAMDIVAASKSLFEDLPSQARKHFENDPGQFMDWAQDPANQKALDALEAGEWPPEWAQAFQEPGTAETASEDVSTAPADKPKGASDAPVE